MASDPAEYVEVEEAAKLLHVSVSTLRKKLWRREWPELRAVKHGPLMKWLIPMSGIRARFDRLESEIYRGRR